jgi:hypothetical protein
MGGQRRTRTTLIVLTSIIDEGGQDAVVVNLIHYVPGTSTLLFHCSTSDFELGGPGSDPRQELNKDHRHKDPKTLFPSAGAGSRR